MATVVVAGLLRVGYLVWFCPFDLAPDEAYYWDWSRQLDWCYYSKGPLVAWLIHAAELTCGNWLRDPHGTAMPVVRLPAVVCGQLLALGCFCLTWQVSGSAVLAYLTMLALLLTPQHSAVSTLMTIDSPYLCCWQWALVYAWRALGLTASRNRAADTHRSADTTLLAKTEPSVANREWRIAPGIADWLLLGLIIGLGTLAKPTMVLFPVCLGLFLVWYNPHGRLTPSAGHGGLTATVPESFAWSANGHVGTKATGHGGLSPTAPGSLRAVAQLRTGQRGLWWRFAAMLAIAGLIAGGPILWWNAQHDWVTFRHIFTQATLAGTVRWRFWGWLEYLGVQAALLFGGGMIAWLAASGAAIRSHLWRQGATTDGSGPLSGHFRSARWSSPLQLPSQVAWFLLCFSWPVFLVFAGFSLRTGIQPNWPVSAYLAAIPLSAVWIYRTAGATGWLFRCFRGTFALSAVLALAANGILHCPDLAYTTGLLPTLARLTRQDDKAQWPRRFDPTCRLQGWHELADAVHDLRRKYRQLGQEPVLAATYYGTAAELAFYLPDQPRVYCLNRVNDLRLSQYDLWRPNPTADPEHFTGRTFLCIGPQSAQASAGFASLQLVGTVVVKRHGYEIAREWIYLGCGFRGFPPSQNPLSY